MASRNPPVALYGVEGWLDPRNAEMRAYIIDLALELGRLGFDEIVLQDFVFPWSYRDEAEDAVILAFLRDMAAALGRIDVTLSVMTREADWWYHPYGEAPLVRTEMAQFSNIISRFYCLLEPETVVDEARLGALLAAAEAVLGEAAAHRFVPAGAGSGPEKGNWLVRPVAGEVG